MNKYLNEWNSLSDSIPKGNGLHPRRDYAHSILVNLHYYASIIGLMVAIAPYFLSFLGVV